MDHFGLIQESFAALGRKRLFDDAGGMDLIVGCRGVFSCVLEDDC